MTAWLAVQEADRKIGFRLDAQERWPNQQPKPGEKADLLDPPAPWAELEDTLRPVEAQARP
jgi:hypothetical protein